MEKSFNGSYLKVNVLTLYLTQRTPQMKKKMKINENKHKTWKLRKWNWYSEMYIQYERKDETFRE